MPKTLLTPEDLSPFLTAQYSVTCQSLEFIHVPIMVVPLWDHCGITIKCLSNKICQSLRTEAWTKLGL